MNRKLLANILSLYGVQAMGYLIPLVTLPYVARVLGPRELGAIAFAEAYANNLSIIIEFGFGLSASREIARLTNHVEAKAQQVSEVFGAQFLLVAASIALTIALSIAFPHRFLAAGFSYWQSYSRLVGR